METPSFSLRWAPGFVGMAIGFALYGVSLGQFLFYVRFFPDDHLILKSLVLGVFVLDTAHTVTTGSFYWRELVACRGTTSYECTLALPWDLNTILVCNALVAFFVQRCDAWSMVCASESHCPMSAFMRTECG
ncbi:hypothetical protein J3A83DRAFT_4214820 [Scleroderma citrinum]